MAWKWFVQLNDAVDGPLSTDEVTSRLVDGHLTKAQLIWGPTMDAWMNLQQWQQNISGFGEGTAPEPTTEAWHYAVGGQSHGPMSRPQLVDELKSLQGGDVMVWTKGMKEWAPLYEFHDLLNEIGINKRQFPRAELTGKAVLRTEGNVTIAPLLSISEGGFGVALEEGLTSGQAVTVELQSAVFLGSLHIKAEVRYVGEGVIGFKFTQISQEAKGTIIQFIKQNQIRFPIKAA
jgi:hypothetical protein